MFSNLWPFNINIKTYIYNQRLLVLLRIIRKKCGGSKTYDFTGEDVLAFCNILPTGCMQLIPTMVNFQKITVILNWNKISAACQEIVNIHVMYAINS